MPDAQSITLLLRERETAAQIFFKKTSAFPRISTGGGSKAFLHKINKDGF